jgi:hypothetical protein
MSYEQLYDIFNGKSNSRMEKAKFLVCMQGLQQDIAIEDLLEMFNYIDSNSENIVSKVQFVDAFTYISNRLGFSNES